MHENIQRAFPTIFPRHLDVTFIRYEQVLLVNDTEKDDDFMIMNVNLDPTKLRRDGYN